MSDRLRTIYERVTSWQRRTFPMPDADHAKSLLAHMRLELKEIEAAPHDIEERADMAILAMGVFDRLGMEPHIGYGDAFGTWAWGKCGTGTATHLLSVFIAERDPRFLALRHILVGCTFGIPSLDSEDVFLSAISAKMDKNEARRWPTPDQQVPGEPVEHIRDEDLQFDAVTAALTPAPDIVASEVDRLRARVAELEAQLKKEWTCAREYEQMALSAGRTHRGQMDAIAEVLKPGIGPDVPASLIIDGVGRMAAERDRLRVERDRFISEVNTLRNREGGQ